MALSVPPQLLPAPYGRDQYGNPLPAPPDRTGSIARGDPTDQSPTATGGGQGGSEATTPTPAPVTTVNPTATTTGSGGYSGPNLLDPFNATFTPPTPQALPSAPNYTAPSFAPPPYKPPPAFSYSDFSAPSMTDAENDPGYKFGLQQGEQSLTNSRAAQGILGTGSTLKDILKFGGDYATTRYDDLFNRQLTGYQTNRSNALGTYETNYQTQYTDPYKYAYQGALDAFAPQMAQFQANVGAGNLGYSTQSANVQHTNDVNNTNAWNSYLFDYQKNKDKIGFIQQGLS